MFGTLRYSAIAEKGTVNHFQEKDTLCVVTEYVKEDPNAGPEGRQWKMSELNYTKRGIVQRKFNTTKLSLK